LTVCGGDAAAVERSRTLVRKIWLLALPGNARRRSIVPEKRQLSRARALHLARAMLRHLLVIVPLLAACTDSTTDDDYPFPDGDGPLGKGDGITNLPVSMNPPTAGTFMQEIDHPRQAGPSIGQFAQRFWYSTQFAKSADAPVIFYFCGEAPCDPWYATTMADAAYALNAAVVVLEHRYYGASLPYPDLTLDHMKYLTIHNALEDAAAFETWAKANLPLSGKWIAVGGSYPGMLAAFYREKHPELVVGAWASSAPVNVELSFAGYDAIASNALGPTCTLLWQQVLSYASAQYDNATTRDSFSMMVFGSPAPAAKADFMNWFSFYAEGAAQYGKQRKLCAALEQEQANPIDGFMGYLYPPLANDPPPGSPAGPTVPGGPSGPVPRGEIVSSLAAPAQLTSFSGSEWFYQVCTEVGFYQIHNFDRTHSVMSDLITEQYWSDQCQQWVGTAPAIAATRSEFLDPLTRGEVSNVYFVNGSLDPWSSLSFTDSSAPAGLTTLVVATGSHCEDLQNLTTDMVLGVFKAHKQFHDLARTWLQ
jgi:pimeloyl-ACP methyl ester carboxylesterase